MSALLAQTTTHRLGKAPRSARPGTGEAVSIIQEHVSSAMFSGLCTEPGACAPMIAGREVHERNGGADRSIEDIRGLVRLAMQHASRTIFDLGLEDPRYAGMSIAGVERTKSRKSPITRALGL